MNSMTGFSALEVQYEDFSATLEIKGYNSRYLEMSITMPRYFSKYETELRRLVSDYCRRGKVEINVQIKEAAPAFAVSVNTNAAAAYIAAGERIMQEARDSSVQFESRVNLSQFMALQGVLEIEDTSICCDSKWELIKPHFVSALERFCVEREREGLHTEKNIFLHIETIENAVKEIAAYVPQIEGAIKENIKKRFEELHIDGVDDNRVLAETAILLMKYTIAEEISRLDAHMKEFRAETKRNKSPGKKLDFLSQEIAREINTIGSKSTLLEVSKLVVNMKDSLENIREQLRNIE
ncbi:MAG: YicC family protein [Spirochaetaceae bacterium]|nr:YicC family protein [Spirochaetaceae bacterium]